MVVPTVPSTSARKFSHGLLSIPAMNILAKLSFLYFLASVAFAQTLTSTFQFTGSGLIGIPATPTTPFQGQTFTNAAINVTTVGSTANVASYGSCYYVPSASATASIAGIGTFQLTSTGVTNCVIVDPVKGVVGDIIYFVVASSPSSLAYSSPSPVATAITSSTSWNMLGSFGPFQTEINLVSFPMVTTSGTLQFTSQGSAGTFQATLTAGPPPGLSQFVVSPPSLTLTTTINGTISQSLTVNSNGGALSYQASANVQWLSVMTPNGTTPGSVSVYVFSSGLSAGSYNGNITLMSPQASNSPFVIPVTLVVSAITASPTSLTFNAVQGGPSPAAQTLTLGSSVSNVVVFQTGNTLPTWLTLTNWFGTGTLPVTIPVVINLSGLPAGTYSYSLEFNTINNASVTVPITLLVTAPGLVVTTNQLQFQSAADSPNPPAQNLTVTSTGSPLATSITSSASWLVPSAKSGATPFTLSIQPNAVGLVVGTYTGDVIITDTSSATDVQTVKVTLTVSQPILTITNVTNAAIPSLDYPAATIHLVQRSMATIFGTNLADSTASSTSPWSNALGGTQVHLAADTCFAVSCDLVASLIYVSPTQINFLVPDNGSTSCVNCAPIPYRIVFVRDGQRIDDQSYMLGGAGRLFIDPFDTADYNVVFQVGYDCLFSYSLLQPASCGLSWSTGQYRQPVGAITDAVSGQLISSQFPVHQGQIIILWMTGLYGGVTLNSGNGLLQQANPAPVAFGVAQLGTDLAAPLRWGQSPTPLWAGESPQFVGLDQVNTAFPTCGNYPATTEKRYDAFLTYTSVATGTTVRIYLPFVVRAGDPDCQW